MSYVLAILVCGHEAEAPMSEIQLLRTFCHNPECRCSRGIVDVNTSEWYSHCYDCRHKKYFGNNKELAKEAARKHWRKYNSHRSSIARGPRPKSIDAKAVIIKRLGGVAAQQ